MNRTLGLFLALCLIAIPIGCEQPQPTPVDPPDETTAPDAPETPDAPAAPETPEVPEPPVAPDVPVEPPIETPEAPEVPAIPDLPIEVPPIPDVPTLPVTGQPADEAPRVAVTVSSVTVEDPAVAARLATQEAITQLLQLGCEAKGIIFFEFFPKTVAVENPDDPATKELPDTDKEKLILPAVRAASGDLPVIGCRARSLVMSGTKLQNTVSVMAIGGSDVDIAIAKAPLDDNRRSVGKELAESLSGVKDMAIVFALSEMRLSLDTKEGVSVDDFIRGVVDTLGDDVVLLGGNSFPNDIAVGDKGGLQFYGDEVLEGHVVAMGIGGPINVHSNHTNEFEVSDQAVTVTKAEDTWILELDGRPATEVYREIRGMAADEEFTSDSQHPIGVILDDDADKVYLRMVLDEDAERKALKFVAPVPEGTKIKILSGGADPQAILDSAGEAISQSVAAAADETPVVALLSNCYARGMQLRELLNGEGCEVQGAILPSMGDMQFPIFGFYAWGELGPIAGEFEGLRSMHQQHTFVSVVLTEKPNSVIGEPATVEEEPIPIMEDPAAVEEETAPTEEPPAEIEVTPQPLGTIPAPIETTPPVVEPIPVPAEATLLPVETEPQPEEAEEAPTADPAPANS